MRDLWPTDISQSTITAPVTILREQAALLGRKTSNLVEGDVISLQDDWHSTGEFRYAFFIEAPTLKYQYQLFTISHSVDLYPVDFEMPNDIKLELGVDPTSAFAQAEDENDFVALLGAIFNAQRTRRVISALLSQIDRPKVVFSNSSEELPF